jgi:acyl carrier protein
MTQSEGTAEQRIQQTIVRALGISKYDPSLPLRMGSTPGWDSMGHMMVVMELEKQFNVRFPPYRLPELLDIPSIAKILEASGVTLNGGSL